MTYVNAVIARRRAGRWGLSGGATDVVDRSVSQGSAMAIDQGAIASSASPSTVLQAAMAAIGAIREQPTSRDLAAVRTFQTAYGQGLRVDGNPGSATRAALTRITGVTFGSSSVAPTPDRPTSYLPPVAPPPEMVPQTTSVDIGGGPRPAWVVPALTVGGIVLLGAGVMLFNRGLTMNKRSSRLRRNRRGGKRRSR